MEKVLRIAHARPADSTAVAARCLWLQKSDPHQGVLVAGIIKPFILVQLRDSEGSAALAKNWRRVNVRLAGVCFYDAAADPLRLVRNHAIHYFEPEAGMGA